MRRIDTKGDPMSDQSTHFPTVAVMLRDVARERPDSLAIIDGDRELTFEQLYREARRAAEMLRESGIRSGDRVAIVLPNGIGYVATYFGCQLLGVISVLVNTRLAAPEIAHILEDSGAALTVVSPEFAEKVSGSRAGTITDVSALVTDGAGGTEPGESFEGLSVPPSATAQLLYTSGTTGRPKGVEQTHANLMFNAGSVARYLEAAPGERTLIAAPMFHAIGIVSQLVGFAAAGATSVIMPAFDAVSAAEIIAREKVTIFAGVPAMLRLLLLKARDSGHDLSSMRKFVMGGSPVPASLAGEVEQLLPGLVLGNVWGQTEASSITTYTEGADYSAHPGSAGRPVEGLEVWVSVDGEEPADIREVDGELCIRGASVTAGYWNNPRATADTFVDGWLHTGDVGTVSTDGHVYVHDRLKDMIIRGGENVYSLEVESALITHPSVAEIAVVGRPDHVLGERVCAVVVPLPGADVDEDELRDFARQTLANYKVPEDIIVVEELPRNATGKILKRKLADTVATEEF